MTSKYRSVAVAASWLIASRKPIDSTGQRSASAVDRKATSVPAERSPSATWTDAEHERGADGELGQARR